jgi:hypothetical protein
MSAFENIEIILKKRQDNIKNKQMWWNGLTDEECKLYNRYYIKKLRETPEKREAEHLYNSEKITCECSCIVSRGNYSKHKKSIKHVDMLETIKSLSEDQQAKLNENLKAQIKAKEERAIYNLQQQFKRLDTLKKEENSQTKE